MPNNLPALSKGKIAAVILALIAGFFIFKSCRMDGEASKPSFRRVAVTRQDLSVTKTATGEVTPQNRVEIKPPIAGRIEEVLVREGEAVVQGQTLAWMSSSERAALLDAARSQGEEALARWQAAYKPAPLVSPLNGTLIVRAVEPGQTVTTADPVVVVADRLIVKAQVDETDIASIAVGQQASIGLDAFPKERIPSHVDHIAYEAKTVNNVTIYEVDVLPEQVPDFMRSGMTATVSFTVSSKPDTLALPAEAVRQSPSGARVFLPSNKPWKKPVFAEVTTGITDGKWIEIVSGIKEGDIVLTPSVSGSGPHKDKRSNSPFSPFGSRTGGGGRGSR